MSKSGIQQLRSGNQQAYERLMRLMRDAYHEDNPPAKQPKEQDVRVPAGTAAALRQTADPVARAQAAFNLAQAVPRQTRAQAAAAQPVAARTRARATAA